MWQHPTREISCLRIKVATDATLFVNVYTCSSFPNGTQIEEWVGCFGCEL